MSRSDVLVDADWVEAHIDDPQVAIVEVDEDTSAYEKNHMKNAIRIDWTKDLQDPVRRDFVDQAGFEKLLSEKGIGNDTLVVLYGGNNNWFASYAYWYFKLYGHENVKLLDGGRKKWELDSRDLTDAVPTRPATQYKAKPQDESIRAYRDDVVKAIGSQNLVDVRSPDEFSGKLLAPAHPRKGGEWLPFPEYVREFKGERAMFLYLAENDLRRIAVTGWMQGKYRESAVTLVQFRSNAVMGAADHFGDSSRTCRKRRKGPGTPVTRSKAPTPAATSCTPSSGRPATCPSTAPGRWPCAATS
ncbi:hypothetical protein SMICM304S_05643 [Streptomyces microflavus]